MTTVFLDFETRSVADLKKVGLYNYARHASTDVWCLCYAVGDGPVETWRPGDAVPEWAGSDCEIVAHNAPFEIAIWNVILVGKYGWPALRLERVTCTAARAYAMALPGNLAGACAAMGLRVQKDVEGHALMLRMCRPRRMDGDTPVWWDDAERVARLIAYCKVDVEAERELYKVLFPLGESETAMWRIDYVINQRGIHVDRQAVVAAIREVKKAKAELDKQMADLTGGAVQSCSALAALKDWLAEQGVVGDDGGRVDLAKADVRELLERLRASHNPKAAHVVPALLMRQEAGKASTAKLATMLEIAAGDDRMRGLFQYHGAATGRWAGRMIQPHNFPRDVPKQATVEKMFALLKQGMGGAIDLIYGPVMDVVSRCLRGFITPAPGHVLIVGDFSSVEGRGTAWHAGEEWKLRAFREADAGTGPGLYELAYAKSFGVPVESVKNPSWERQIGKVMELAFGYGGGVGAFKAMGSSYGISVPDSEADGFKQSWRAAHPATKRVWYALENAAVSACQNPGQVYAAGAPGRQVKFRKVGSFLWCLLPSGRTLCYAYPGVIEGTYGPQLTYFTVPSTNDLLRGKTIDDPANTKSWARIATYGGSLLENVVQALCRDLLADAIKHCEAEGVPVVMHVHDEIVCEVPEADAERGLAVLTHAMNNPQPWAKDFPLHAECKIMTRYGK